MLGIVREDEAAFQNMWLQFPMNNLPHLTNEEIELLESARARYEILVGIVDAENYNYEPETILADQLRYPQFVGTNVIDEDDLRSMLYDITRCQMKKIATFIYLEIAEEIAAGLGPTGDNGVKFINELHTALVKEFNLER